MKRHYLWAIVAVACATVWEIGSFLGPVDPWPARMWPVIVVIAVWQAIAWRRIAGLWEQTARNWRRQSELWRDTAHAACTQRIENLNFWEHIMNEEYRR